MSCTVKCPMLLGDLVHITWGSRIPYHWFGEEEYQRGRHFYIVSKQIHNDAFLHFEVSFYLCDIDDLNKESREMNYISQKNLEKVFGIVNSDMRNESHLHCGDIVFYQEHIEPYIISKIEICFDDQIVIQLQDKTHNIITTNVDEITIHTRPWSSIDVMNIIRLNDTSTTNLISNGMY